MPEGPLFGVSRPFANDVIDGEVVFTRPFTSGRVTVPEWLRDIFNIQSGDRIKYTGFPMDEGVLDLGRSFSNTVNMTERNMINIPLSVTREYRLVEGDPILILVEDIK